ncbi:GNAT family N-acetyltransferase [Hasllibacter sp. MH4015]|uniref:GNAT family N-acetyltransferase n=1 Tax=Hasllibacter sp. MH4015 TaxID=2854029 RepID=UPI001CD285A3|nr:GNAT family N-acetyltransferase [Hasllibacter sp. MH4015]
MSDIRVRAFAEGDRDAFLSLYRDCLRHYGTGPARPDIEAEIVADLAAPRGMSAHLAWRGDEALGFTTWVRVYPAMDGVAIYLKELYVTADARGLGAGRALMRDLATTAMEIGAVRLEWGSFQPDALEFYDALGAARKDKVHYSVAAEDLHGFAQ